MLAMMKRRKGEISGMLLVNVYAMDFFRLSKMRRPAAMDEIHRRGEEERFCEICVHNDVILCKYDKYIMQLELSVFSCFMKFADLSGDPTASSHYTHYK